MRPWGGPSASAGPILQEEKKSTRRDSEGGEGGDGCCHLDAARSAGGQRAV